jgi:hypothetical protein
MLMLIALIIKLIWWILGAVVLYLLFRVGIAAADRASISGSPSPACRSDRSAGRPAAPLGAAR